MKPNQLLVTVTLALAALLPLKAEEVNEIIIEAHCDGGHAIHIRPGSIYWENGNAVKPGRMSTLNEPTYVNGKPWIPRWRKNPKGDIGTDTSMPFSISIGTADLEFELLSVTAQRGESGILPRAPVVAQKEKAEFVVTISDPESGGCWYKFAVRKKKK